MTPLHPVVQYLTGETVDHFQPPLNQLQIEAKFEKIEEISTRKQSKFIYAHFLLPHPPFLFNRDGTHVTGDQASQRTHEQAYVEQLLFTNARILSLVDAIRANSAKPPIIVIQADEGPVWQPHDEGKPYAAKLQKRTSIISAYHLPGHDAKALMTDSPTPVNTFRVIFSSYFGADLPSLPDQVFFWDHADATGIPDETRAVKVVDVTAEVMQGPLARSPSIDSPTRDSNSAVPTLPTEP